MDGCGRALLTEAGANPGWVSVDGIRNYAKQAMRNNPGSFLGGGSLIELGGHMMSRNGWPMSHWIL